MPAAVVCKEDGKSLAEPVSLRRRLATVVAVSAGTRLILFLVMAITTPVPPAGQMPAFLREAAALFDGSPFLERLFLPWTRWDGLWYVTVAHHGYARPWSEAFYPLYPGLMRVVSPLTGGNYVIAGILLSTCFFLGAMAVLYYLVSLDFSARVALWTTVLLAAFPTGFFFQAVYADSLLLLLTVACVLFSRRGRWALAGSTALLAVLTRSTGLVLLVPMVVFHLQQREWRWRRVDRQALWFLLPPAGMLIWISYLWAATGDPLGSVRAESHWGRGFTVPFVTVYRGFAEAVRHFDRTVIQGGWGTAGLHDMLAAIILVACVALLWAGWRRIPPAYTAFVVALLVVPLCFPGAERPLFSLPRLALTAFPVFLALALVTDGLRWQRWLRIALAVLFMAGSCWFACEFARHVFVG